MVVVMKERASDTEVEAVIVTAQRCCCAVSVSVENGERSSGMGVSGSRTTDAPPYFAGVAAGRAR